MQMYWPLLVVLLLGLAGCAPKQTPPPPPPKRVQTTPAATATTITSTRGYVIDIPAGWTNREINKGMLDRIISKPGASNGFAVNANVVIEPMPSPMSVEAAATKNMQTTKKALKTTIVSSAPFTGQVEGYKAVYTWAYGSKPLKVAAYFFVKDTNTYVFTCSATEATFAADEPAFDQMAKSFRWK